MPPWVYIVPQKVWEPYVGASLSEIRDVRNTPSIGSGPFTLTGWQQGQGWTMERNPYFWGPEPEVDRIEYQLFTNQEAMIQALRNGEIDIADGIKPQLIESVDGIESVEVQEVVSDWWLNLAFNFGGQSPQADPLPALRDHAVREAIAMAIDKQAIVEKVYRGTAETGDTIIRPASAYWHLDIPADQELPFDIAGANTLLDGAGYADTDGDGVREDPETSEPLEMLIPASDDTTGAVEAGQLIVGYLRQIGIAVNLAPVSDAKMGDFWGAGDFDAYIWYWSGDPDPNYQLFVFTSDQCGAWSDGCWQDPGFDALYEEQGATFDREQRRQVVFEAQEYVYDQIPGVVLAYPGWLQAYRTDRFEGWVPAPGADGYLLPGYNYDSLVELRSVSASAVETGSVGDAGVDLGRRVRGGRSRDTRGGAPRSPGRGGRGVGRSRTPQRAARHRPLHWVRCRPPSCSGPNGEMRARARRSTTSPTAWTWSFAIRAGTTPVTPSSRKVVCSSCS